MTITSGQEAENDITGLVKTLVSVIEERDPFMKGHAERVATNCVLFSRQLGLSKMQINQIYLAGLLHDIGIVYIPLEITQKSGELPEEEMDMVKKHPLISEKILSKHDMLKAILPIIRHHHESFDGSGYPDGLKAEEIPIDGILLHGAYDVLTALEHLLAADTTDFTHEPGDELPVATTVIGDPADDHNCPHRVVVLPPHAHSP